MRRSKLEQRMVALSRGAARGAGSSWAFAAAVGVVVLWVVTGPLFGFSDTWQLVINTGTTIVTFLMVFLIQNSQNRDTEALQIKLDELINAVRGANEALLDLEQLDEKELDKIRKTYLAKAAGARREGNNQRPGKTEGNVDDQGA